MKIKLDENMPVRLADSLRDLGHEVDTVAEEGMKGLPDAHIWDAVSKEPRFLVSQDLDFSDIRRYHDSDAGALIVRLNDPGRENLYNRVMQLFRTEHVQDWDNCLVIVTEKKVRIRPIP